MSYEVRLSPGAVRQYRKLPTTLQSNIKRALSRLGERVAEGSAAGRGGKSVKLIQGRRDRFYRLRVGEYRVMFDLVDPESVVLVLGIVHRGDLERWLRGR